MVFWIDESLPGPSKGFQLACGGGMFSVAYSMIQCNTTSRVQPASRKAKLYDMSAN